MDMDFAGYLRVVKKKNLLNFSPKVNNLTIILASFGENKLS